MIGDVSYHDWWFSSACFLEKWKSFAYKFLIRRKDLTSWKSKTESESESELKKKSENLNSCSARSNQCQTTKELPVPAWQKIKQKCQDERKKYMGSHRIEIHFIEDVAQCTTQFISKAAHWEKFSKF